eukprot:4948715-Karenia_brevis.AAC.1
MAPQPYVRPACKPAESKKRNPRRNDPNHTHTCQGRMQISGSRRYASEGWCTSATTKTNCPISSDS